MYDSLIVGSLYMKMAAKHMHDPATNHALAAVETQAPPPGILVADRYVRAAGYYSQRSQGTRDWLLTFTLAGEGRQGSGSEEVRMQQGDVTLLEPGTPHDYRTAGDGTDWDFYWVHFAPRNSWLRWLQWPEAAAGVRRQRIFEEAARGRIRRVFQRLVADSRGLGVWQDELSANALEEILILVAQQQLRAASRPMDPRVEATVAHVNEQFRSPLSVVALAAQVALSPSRLAHLFKHETGEAIMEMVMRVRLRHTARLLEFTSLSVAEVARDAGFASPFYFSRQFSAYYGHSPTAYRRQVRSTD
jgi:AraC family transcriptional regulator, arabinose operon regulatory protein